MPSPSPSRSIAVLAVVLSPGGGEPFAARLRSIVEDAGGRFETAPPGTLLALFGVPHGDEEDAGRAARVGLLMLREGRPPGDPAHPVRLGLHWGDPRWPTASTGSGEAMAELADEARRLASLASPGTLLASPGAVRAAGARVRFRPSAHPPAQEAVGEIETRQTGRDIARTPTVGREEELQKLLAFVDRGAGGFVLVEGDPGVGKSRLGWEFRRRVSSRGTVVVASGRCYEGPASPLGPFGDILRAAVGVTGQDPRDGDRVADFVRGHLDTAIPDAIERENCSHLVALSIGLRPTDTRVAHIEPARIRSEIHYAWVRWLSALAARQPILLSLEDLHWADDASFALLESLAAGLSGEPILIFGTRRPSAKTPRGCERLRLAELPQEATLELAEAILRTPVSPALADFLHQQTGGHPYYLEELARYLQDSGLVAGSPLTLVQAPGRMPEGLQGLLVARIQGLGVEDSEVLKAASVYGLTFWAGLLERTLFRKVDRTLERSRRRQIIFSLTRSLVPGEEELSFRHALLRDAAYSILVPAERTRLHRVAADLLQPHIAAGGRRVRALVARHREAAGQKEEPARLWQESAREALLDSEYVEALGYAREALRLGHGPAARLVAGRALLRLAQVDEALVEAKAIVESQDASAEEVANAKLLQAEIFGRRGDPERFLALVEEVERAQPPGTVLIDTLGRKARVLWSLGRHDRALECIAEVRRRLESAIGVLGDREAGRLLAEMHSVEGLVCWRQGKMQEAAACYGRALDVAGRVGDRLAAATALNSMGALHRDLRADAKAKEAFEQAAVLLREMGDRIGIATAMANLGLVLRETGDLPAAAAAHRESIAIFRQAGETHTVARGIKALSDVLIDDGDFRGAIQALSEATELATGDRTAELLVLRNLGQAHAALGEHAGAQAKLTAALDRARSLASHFNIAWIHLRLSELHEDAGRRTEALSEAAEALRVAEQHRLAEMQVSAQAQSARLLAESDPGAARAAADSALGRASALGAKAREATALFVLARLDAAGAADRIERATGLASQVPVLLDRCRLAEDEAAARLARGDADGARKALEAGSALAAGRGAAALAARLDRMTGTAAAGR